MTSRITRAAAHDGAGLGAGTNPAKGARFLVVGDHVPPDLGGDDRTPADITCLTFAEVTAEVLEELRPDVVLSSLVSPGFDCLDLAERLVDAGYRGKYRAVAPTVPDPDLVRREISARFPALDFDLVGLDKRR